tara:strand:- start:96 stop:242 length:147 start_codon:yes stop_codon:yes gene_type:complete
MDIPYIVHRIDAVNPVKRKAYDKSSAFLVVYVLYNCGNKTDDEKAHPK